MIGLRWRMISWLSEKQTTAIKDRYGNRMCKSDVCIMSLSKIRIYSMFIQSFSCFFFFICLILTQINSNSAFYLLSSGYSAFLLNMTRFLLSIFQFENSFSLSLHFLPLPLPHSLSQQLNSNQFHLECRCAV